MRVDAAAVVARVRLFLAFVYVSADLFVGFVTSSCWAYAREATQSVAALAARTIRLVHITFINIPTDSISIGMEPRVTNALVSWLQVLAGAVRTDARDHRTLIDVCASVVLTRAFGTQDVILLASVFRTLFASDTPT